MAISLGTIVGERGENSVLPWRGSSSKTQESSCSTKPLATSTTNLKLWSRRR